MIDKTKINQSLSDASGTALNQIKEDTALASDLNLSPVEVLDIFSRLVREFKIQIPQDFNMENIKSVQDLYNALEDLDADL
jgi:acyl carrier protein